MSKETGKKSGYAKDGGVDTQAADDWVERLQGVGARFAKSALASKVVTGIGDYAAVFAQSENNWVAASCDGVGTKLLWTLQGLGRVEDLAQDLLAMNVNDVLCVGARPTLFLDYLAVGSKSLLKKGGLLEGFIGALNEHCSQTGQVLVGGETAQMPDLYDEGHFDLAGFSIGFLKPEEFLSIESVRPGSEVWAWDSTGPHSNGYSWLRKLFDATADKDLIRKHFMKPTKLYVNEFAELRLDLAKANQPRALQAAFHITGSGFLNFLRAQPKQRVIGFDLSEYSLQNSIPEWMKIIKQRSQASWEELLTSFNGGIGMALVMDQQWCQHNAALLVSRGLKKIGTVIAEPKVKISGLNDLT